MRNFKSRLFQYRMNIKIFFARPENNNNPQITTLIVSKVNICFALSVISLVY